MVYDLPPDLTDALLWLEDSLDMGFIIPIGELISESNGSGVELSHGGGIPIFWCPQPMWARAASPSSGASIPDHIARSRKRRSRISSSIVKGREARKKES